MSSSTTSNYSICEFSLLDFVIISKSHKCFLKPNKLMAPIILCVIWSGALQVNQGFTFNKYLEGWWRKKKEEIRAEQ